MQLSDICSFLNHKLDNKLTSLNKAKFNETQWPYLDSSCTHFFRRNRSESVLESVSRVTNGFLSPCQRLESLSRQLIDSLIRRFSINRLIDSLTFEQLFFKNVYLYHEFNKLIYSYRKIYVMYNVNACYLNKCSLKALGTVFYCY